MFRAAIHWPSSHAPQAAAIGRIAFSRELFPGAARPLMRKPPNGPCRPYAEGAHVCPPRDDWPPQRAVAGFDLPHDTPFAGLWNVGDAVKEYANGGTTACAETAQLVADKIIAAYPLVDAPASGR